MVNFILLLAMGTMWGSAFAETKIALEAFSPMEAVAWRMLLAGIFLSALVVLRGGSLLPGRRFILWLAGIALVGYIIPFYLIALGQTRIDSALAGILIGATPLFTMAGAHIFIAEEKWTPARMFGGVLSFTGICLLLGPGALLNVWHGSMLAQLSVLLAALSFGAGLIVARKMPDAPFMMKSANVALIGAVLAFPLALLDGSSGGVEAVALRHILALLALGVFPTALGTVCFFVLVSRAGAGFTSLGNYVAPLTAIGAGYYALGENTEIMDIIALVLILAGIFIARPEEEKVLKV